MRRILIFSLTYHPFVGGAELAIKEITDRLPESEYHLDLITLRFDKNLPEVERIGNVTVYRIGLTSDAPKISDRRIPLTAKIAKLLFPFGAFSKATTLHKKNTYDMTWAMMANQAAFGALLFKYFNPSVTYFLELQDGNTLNEVKRRQPFLRLIWGLYKQLYLQADIIKAISRFIAKQVGELGFSGPLLVIPNAVDVRKFSIVPDEKVFALRTRFGKKMGDVFLFTASRLVLSRGVEDIIRALPLLPSNIKLLIAGSGDDREKLEHIAKECAAFERVMFAGHVPHSELPAYYKISDIFVRPSIVEGFGSAFVEAFAAGIPVIATPVGGITDFLFSPENSHKPTGLFCKVHDPKSIADAVKLYIDDPQLLAEIVRNTKELVSKKYDWDIIARDMREKIFGALPKNG